MGTTTVALAVSGAAVLAFALVAWLSVRARNHAELRTQGVLLRISDGMESISTSLDGFASREEVRPGGDVSIPVTLDLTAALQQVASIAAALPGMTAGAARVDRLDGSPAVNAVGIHSGSTGLESAPDPPDHHPWRSVTLEWSQAPLQGAGGRAIQRGVIVPIEHEGRRIGFLGAYTDAPVIDTAVAEAVVQLARIAGPSLDAAREHEAVQELVRTDPLTGMLNRRGYDEELSRELARAARTGHPLSVLMLDIDDFRDVNKQTYAHGDDVLREFGLVIREGCRETDIPCRRGGEEFAIILPDTPCPAALRVDARIRALVSTTDFPHVGRITYSAGVTTLREGDTSLSIDERASILVNQVKRNGKNDVTHDCEDLLEGAGPHEAPLAAAEADPLTSLTQEQRQALGGILGLPPGEALALLRSLLVSDADGGPFGPQP